MCDRLIEETKLSRDPHFLSNHLVECAVGSAFEQYEFSHAYRNGSLKRLYHRMTMPKRKATLRKTMHDSAWMFDRVVRANIISQNQGAVIVYPSPEQQADSDVAHALGVLKTVTRVLNLNDTDEVREEFASLHELASH